MQKSKIEPYFNGFFFITLFLVILVVASLISVISKIISVVLK